MKELIDLEWERKKGAGRDLKEIARTFRGFQKPISFGCKEGWFVVVVMRDDRGEENGGSWRVGL
ncbi:hypothetical protein Pyn_27302 [Prunus yedoensis var. nudiflora]|uniref:Uncharacterized protein n=1 Tax=Prunus yedoensis var. nudiflora TaxID=2094558 RepID=A0A314UM88_PRUYE|nr:hypothetical protein Pyn_27302 [Prunus yedoensis var. nudiflora]